MTDLLLPDVPKGQLQLTLLAASRRAVELYSLSVQLLWLATGSVLSLRAG